MANEAVTKKPQPETKRPLKQSHERTSSKAFLKTHDEGQTRQPDRPTATSQRAVAPPVVTVIRPTAPHPPPPPVFREMVQRRQAEKPVEEYGREPDLGQAIQQRRGQGNPLPEDVQTKLENGLQTSLADTRIHTDSAADQLSQAVQAKAFTTGSDIFFRQGQYNPDSQSGLHLLAHESAHVAQQRQGPVSGTPTANGVAISDPSDPFEREAVNQADQFIQRLAEEKTPATAPLPVLQKSAGQAASLPAVQREGGGDEILDLEWIIPHTNDQSILVSDCRKLSDKLLLKKELASQVVYVIVTDKLYFYTGGEGAPSDTFKLKKGAATFGAGYYMDKPGQTYWKALAEHKGSVGLYQFTYGANTDRHQMVNWLETGEYARILTKLGEVSAIGILMAIGPGGKGEGSNSEGEEAAAPPVPGWLVQLRKNVETLINQERAKEPKPLDLPSKLTLWYGRKDSQWYMNVFVHFDTQGKEKGHKSLAMKQDEKGDELLVRVRTAVQQILKQEKDKTQSKSAATIPTWAKLLKEQLAAKLKALRKAEPQATDFPDRLGLTELKGDGEKVVNEIHLQLWVDVTRDNKSETLGGTVGWPLREGTKLETIVTPVRQLAAALRAGKAKQGQQNAPVEEKAQEEGAGKTANQPAYPSKVEPLDFRPDLISVPGAENSARMKLDYAAVHGGRDIDVVPAMMRTIIYTWQIYDVSTAVTQEQQAANAKAEQSLAQPESWNVRRERLQRDAESGKLAKGTPLTQENAIVQEQKLALPKKPGDYLIQGNATPKPDENYKRATSRAYLPVRLIWGSVLASEVVDAVPNQVTAIKQQLKDETLSPDDRKRLQEKLTLLEGEEKSLLPDITKKKLKDVTDIIAQLDELDKILKTDKDVGGSEKKDPLALRLKPELLQLWQMVVSTAQSIPTLKKQFEAQKVQLEQLAKRSDLFANRLKPGSIHQFRPIVNLVSKVTGQSYPLMMMLGEAADSTPENRTYSLIDITSSQTQKAYNGSSSKTGDDGHNEAIIEAFRSFGRENQYGEGKIAVRIPQRYGYGFQPRVPKLFESAPGPWEIAIKWLGYAAMAAGLAALILGTVATGGALGVAVVGLGTFSAVVGAGLAAHNMAERHASHRLKWDAETVLDIIAIIGSVVSITGALGAVGRASSLARRAAWIQRFERVDRGLFIYGAGEFAGTVVLTSLKVVDDIEQIENDPELTPDEKKRLIAQVVIGAIQTGGMMMISGAQMAQQGSNPFARSEYKSMVDKGWINPKTKEWTAAAPPSLRGQPKPTPAGGDTTTSGQQAKPGETTAGGQQKAGDTTADGGQKPKPVEKSDGQKKPKLETTADEVAGKLGQEHKDSTAQKPAAETQLPVGGQQAKVGETPAGGGQPQPKPTPTTQETAARQKIDQAKDFKKLRQQVAKEANPTEGAQLLQQQREAVITEVQQVVTPVLEKKHGVTIEYQNLGTPGFQSDMDVTAVASCAKRLELRKKGVPEADIAKQLSLQDIKKEVSASVEASNQMYQELRKKGLDPDKALDANFYTELRVNDLMQHATLKEKQQITFQDQDIVSLAELRRGMSKTEWKKFKDERLASLKVTHEEFAGKNVLSEAKHKFREAEKLENQVRQASLEDLQTQLAQKLESGASIPEIREAMGRLKLKEPDAYGSHAAYSDVVGSQQKGAGAKRDEAKVRDQLRDKFHKGEALSGDEFRQLALAEAGGMDAFMARAGGEKPGSPEHLHYLSQSATSSTGKLHEHTKVTGNSDKDVRDAAKYLSRAQYAAHEAQVPGEGMMAGRDLAQIIGAKSATNPADATLKALESWAKNAGHGNLVGKPAALRDKFVSTARQTSTDLTHDLGVFATSERLRVETTKPKQTTVEAAKPKETTVEAAKPKETTVEAAKPKEVKQLKGPIPDQEPNSLIEQLAIKAARSGQGEQIMGDGPLGDLPRLVANYGPGEWVKMEYVFKRPVKKDSVKLKDGKIVEGKVVEEQVVNIHWFRNKNTGQNVEYKFKERDQSASRNPVSL